MYIKVSDITLCAYDFDGVMTDNRVIVFQDGREAVITNRADGLGVNRIRTLGLPQIIISTETNPVVRARAAKLNLEVIDSCTDKKMAIQDYCQRNGHPLEKVLFIGNDINDLEAMHIVGIPVSPADGHPLVRAVAKIVTVARGGEGVIKEISELLETS